MVNSRISFEYEEEDGCINLHVDNKRLSLSSKKTWEIVSFLVDSLKDLDKKKEDKKAIFKIVLGEK